MGVGKRRVLLEWEAKRLRINSITWKGERGIGGLPTYSSVKFVGLSCYKYFILIKISDCNVGLVNMISQSAVMCNFIFNFCVLFKRVWLNRIVYACAFSLLCLHCMGEIISRKQDWKILYKIIPTSFIG